MSDREAFEVGKIKIWEAFLKEDLADDYHYKFKIDKLEAEKAELETQLKRVNDIRLRLETENTILRECVECYANETTDVIAVRARRALEEVKESEK